MTGDMMGVRMRIAKSEAHMDWDGEVDWNVPYEHRRKVKALVEQFIKDMDVACAIEEGGGE